MEPYLANWLLLCNALLYHDKRAIRRTERLTNMRASVAIGRVRGLAVLPLIVATFASIPIAQAQASDALQVHGGGVVPTGRLAGTGVLNDVVATSAKNAWAVGHSGPLTNPRTLVEHWNGKSWRRVRVAPTAGWLNSVTATSARDVWAVGFTGSAALILHFNGTSWHQVPGPPASGAVLAGVSAVSPRDAWAVGIAGSNSLIVRWNGKTWRRVKSPAQDFLAGVSALSANNVWAVGGLNGTVTLHWNGNGWRQVPSPSPAGGASLESVAAISAHDVWAVGQSVRGTLILRWNGNRWRKVSSPAVAVGAGLLGVSGTSPRDVWAVGTTGGLITSGLAQATSHFVRNAAGGAVPAIAERITAAKVAAPLILQWTGKSWRRVRVHSPAGGAQLIGDFALSGRIAWAVGCTKTFGNRNANPLVVRLNGRSG
jgi:hypothetical protein